MEEPTVIVALISLVGTLVGSISGVLVANKLTTYRIEQLESKLDKYANNVDEIKERLVVVEQSAKSAHHRLDDMVSQLNLKDSRKE